MNNGLLCLICSGPIQGRKNSNAVMCIGECEKEHKRRTQRIRNKGGKPELVERPVAKSRGFVIRRSRLKKNGLDYDQADLLADDPNGYCNSCGEYGKLKVDHDHNHCPYGSGCSLCIRGFLCGGCNLALGHINDSVDKLKCLITYLETSGEI